MRLFRSIRPGCRRRASGPEVTGALAWLLLAGSPVGAQTVSTQVLSRETSQPVVGALVYLLDDSGAVVRTALTDERGRVLFLRFPAGSYRVRAEMIGMATGESNLLEARVGATLHEEIRLDARPIRLEGIAVAVDERCRVRPAEGLLTAQGWDEARKALATAVFTDEQRLYRYQTMLYERDLDRNTRVIRRENQSRREANMRSPFRSRPAEELIDRGFVEPSGGVDLYFAPDANVLLSDVFLDSHCFRLRRGERGETAGLIGLAFEPTSERRRIIDVAGTLWLDPASSELRWLEYRYANLDPDIRSDEIGGRVEFQRMPEGGWIVPEWWIRMPRVALQTDGFRGGRRRYVVGFREAGGMVLDVQGAGRALRHRGTGGIEGVVRDSLGSALEGVRVDIVGAAQEVVTDSAGWFEISGLVEGIYRVRFVDPRLEAYGYSPEPLTPAVFNGEMTHVEFDMPSAASVLTDVCSEVRMVGPEWENLPPQAKGTGILVGWVRDAVTDEPLPGAVVRVLSYRYEFRPGGASVIDRGMFGVQTTTDEEGVYRVCRLPERELLTVVVVYEGVETEGDTLKIMEIGGAREHTVRVIRDRPER